MIEIDRAETIARVLGLTTDNFVELAAAAGLSPSLDFISSDLSGVSFDRCDLSLFDFSYADLRNAKWEGVIKFPDKVTYALRGIGNDRISPYDFSTLESLAFKRKKWSDRFFAFKLIADNFGPVDIALGTLKDIMKLDKSVYMRSCSFTYLAAAYSSDLEASEHCRIMAFDGNSYSNSLRIKKNRRLGEQLAKYIVSISNRNLLPRELNPEELAAIHREASI